jgi:MFS family permease
MYSESDLDAAVAAGAVSAEAAAALRAHVTAWRASPMVDEENFRLLTGFNDIFVAIAGVLLLVGAAWIGGSFAAALGSAAVAILAWGLSEYFTKVRRMALPSIIFLLAFVSGVFGVATGILLGDHGLVQGDRASAAMMALSAAIAAIGAWFHWRRFHVPITIAAGVAAVVGVIVSLLMAIVPVIETMIYPILLILGVGVFLFAMRWDMQDPGRATRKSDVAFWLHLLAAPLIAHPIFQMLGLFSSEISMATALIVVLLYIVMGIVALAVDRRALLVSALAYVVAAIISLFQQFGAVSLNVALAIFVIGSALLTLSAFWQNVRATVIGYLPTELRAKLPPVGQSVATPQPAS